MKKYVLLVMALALLGAAAQAQSVGIGTTEPNASARLDVVASDKGMLVPRVALTSVTLPTPVTSPVEGLLVFNTNVGITGTGAAGKGFYYWTGVRWQKLAGGTEAWGLLGNASVDTSIHFLGTISNAPLMFRVNNQKAGSIQELGENTSLGIGAGQYVKFNNSTFEGERNTFIGYKAGSDEITGGSNTYVGANAGSKNNDGFGNVGIGAGAGSFSSASRFNIAIGNSAGTSTTGSRNIAIGTSTGQAGEGAENIMIGHNVGSFMQGGRGNVWIGNNSATGNFGLFPKSNSDNNVIIGDSAAFLTNGAQANVFIGKRSGLNSHAAKFNVFVGDSSGISNTTGNQNTFVGSKAQGAGIGLVNATAIGSRAVAGADNTLVLGAVQGVNGATAGVNVGIGTTTPAAKLHVVNGSTTGITPNANSTVVIEKAAAPNYLSLLVDNDRESGILFGVAGAPGGAANGGILYNNPSFAQGLQFRTGGNVNRMMIDNLGNVGIGTSAPVQKLEVVGNTRITGELYQGALNANMMPVCYGNILASGTIQASTGNIQSVTKVSTGVYDILITGQSYTTSAFIVQITTTGSVARLAASTASGSALRITIFDAAGAVADGAFHFVVYKP